MSEVPRSSEARKVFGLTAHVGGWTWGLGVFFGSIDEKGDSGETPDCHSDVFSPFQPKPRLSGPKDFDEARDPYSRRECSQALREVMRTLFSVRR